MLSEDLRPGVKDPRPKTHDLLRGGLRSKEGSITVWLVGFFPVLVVILMLIVNVIAMIDARLTMQGAIDRGVYAGASYLAYVMNKVAGFNKTFRDEYLEVNRTFDADSEDSEKWSSEQVELLNTKQAMLYDNMKGLLESGYAVANEISRNVAVKNLENAPHISFKKYGELYGSTGERMFEMINDGPVDGEYINKKIVIATEVTGNSLDPENYKPNPYEVYKYLIKDGGYYVGLAAGIAADFKPPLWPKFFADSNGKFTIHSMAAAQPYGGSIKEYAHTGADDLLYHPALIPIKAVREDIDVWH